MAEVENLDMNQFLQESEWHRADLGSLKRTLPDGTTVEIMKHAVNNYQPVVTAPWALPQYSGSFDTADAAKKHAWECYQDVLRLKE